VIAMLKNILSKCIGGGLHGCNRGNLSVNSGYSKWNKLYKKLMEKREELTTLISTTAILMNKLGYHELADIFIAIVIVLEILALFNRSRGGERAPDLFWSSPTIEARGYSIQEFITYSHSRSKRRR